MEISEITAERIADSNDLASCIETAFNDESVANVRALAAPQTHPDFDGAHCVECGDAIPFQRLEHGRVRCVPCQNAIEHLDKLYARGR